MSNIDRCFTVYKHTSPSGKVYIGITSQEPEKRWRSGSGYVDNQYFTNAIKKYGWKNIKHEILFTNLSREEAIQKEIELIALYKSDDRKYGYNKNPGGTMQSEEGRERIKQTRIAKGLNKKHGVFIRMLWSNPDYRAKATAGRKGIKRTPEQREHYKAGRAKQPPMTEETRRKISETNKLKTGVDAVRSKRVVRVNVETLEILETYINARQASLAFGLSLNAMNLICRQNAQREMKRASKGYFWCYECDYTPELFAKYKGVTLNAQGKIPRTGERASMLGSHVSDDAKKKISEATSKKVMCVETGKVYRNLREAAEDVNGSATVIGRVAKGKGKSAAGLHWEFVDD